MLILHILLALAFSKNSISLTILYEKQVENTVGETYRIYLDQLVKTINELSKETSYKFDLLNVFAHNEYSKIPIYDKISIYAGSNEIDKRKEAIDEISDENIILAISSTLEKDLDDYGEIKQDKIAYMINLDSDTNMNSDLLTTLHRSLLHVLSTLFGFEVPNLLDKKNTEERVLFMKNIKNLEKKQKNADKNVEKEVDSGSMKHNLLETDALVNQFDKIMNLLKSKDSDENNITKDDNNKKQAIDNKKTETKEDKKDATNKTQNKPTDKAANKDIDDRQSHISEKQQNDDLSLKDALKEVIFELRNIRYDLTDSQMHKSDMQTKTYDKDRNTNRRPFNAPYRRFEEYSNENTIGITTNEKNTKEFTPFNFKDKKLTPSDLRPLDTKK
ncbi:hypothetical protein BDAP_000080 [Binucleata daphniae]